MIVEEIMNKDVKTIASDSTVKAAAEQMKKFRIGSLVVMKEGKLAGIITDRDILDKVVATSANATKLKVKDVMTTDVHLISPDKDVEDAAEIMVKNRVKKLPVIVGKRVVGIVTAADMCAAEPKMIEQVSELMLVAKKKPMAG